uniref:Uncharacterized protein n=1 Tax=Setaria italica TaxID=4555 RepID=K4ANK8_SETIT
MDFFCCVVRSLDSPHLPNYRSCLADGNGGVPSSDESLEMFQSCTSTILMHTLYHNPSCLE